VSSGAHQQADARHTSKELKSVRVLRDMGR
jgi:hypothetical protein